MKRNRHTPEQIVRKLRTGEEMLGKGKDLTDVVRHLAISEITWHRWKKFDGGMQAGGAKRLRELDVENKRLKKIVADQALDIDMLKEVAKGNF